MVSRSTKPEFIGISRADYPASGLMSACSTSAPDKPVRHNNPICWDLSVEVTGIGQGFLGKAWIAHRAVMASQSASQFWPYQSEKPSTALRMERSWLDAVTWLKSMFTKGALAMVNVSNLLRT
ncbi:hypothetical protein [Pseudomonas mucidolens]|uniref:hypothetical protein n=1 Tax=Pseudomonas mucidolens TaxID=46679 RepID=UPI0030D9BFFF